VPLDTRTLDYQIYFNKGQRDNLAETAYTSHSTDQLDFEQVVELICKLPEFIDYKAKHLEWIELELQQLLEQGQNLFGFH
jgi:hypothetical protein